MTGHIIRLPPQFILTLAKKQSTVRLPRRFKLFAVVSLPHVWNGPDDGYMGIAGPCKCGNVASLGPAPGKKAYRSTPLTSLNEACSEKLLPLFETKIACVTGGVVIMAHYRHLGKCTIYSDRGAALSVYRFRLVRLDMWTPW